MIENESKDFFFLRFSGSDDADEEVLRQMPHDVFMDINVTYRKLVNNSGRLKSTPLMQKDLQESGIGEDELFEIAKNNTKRLFRPSLFRLEELVDQLMGGHKAEEIYNSSESENKNEMYVLTNEYGSYGAVWMMYDDVLENIAERIGASYYILPSSVHELIIVGENEGIEPYMLKNMVSDINKTVVDTCDKMSDSIYYFDSANMQLKRIA